VVPMNVCHLLLDRPWQYDRDVCHNGKANTPATLEGQGHCSASDDTSI
jgi:hypothetical protein